MSKSKSRKSQPTATPSQAGPNQTEIADSEPATASFKDLRSKIQAQFQTLHDGEATRKAAPGPKPSSSSAGTKSAAAPNSQPDRSKKRARKEAHANNPKDEKPKRRKLSEKVEDEAIEYDEDLKKEVEALGGTSEDLLLLADARSESELSGSDDEISQSKSSRSAIDGLDKGLKNILKEIALAQGDQDEDKVSSESKAEIVPDKQSIPLPKTSAATRNDVAPTGMPAKALKSSKTKFRVEPRPDWYSNSLDQPTDSGKPPKRTPSADSIAQLHQHAKTLLDDENKAYTASQQSSSQSFYNTVIASGTLSDKISALTLAVQESPLHNVRALESLLSLARKRSRSQALDVLRALKDLFAQGSLLPESRKLSAFGTQPVLLFALGSAKSWRSGDKLPPGIEDKHLVVWAFEHWLKDQYFEILKILEVWCNDEIEFSKARAVSYVYELLKERPEQESNLLRLLINKLGDPVKKIASQASYLLMQLLVAHPAMKNVVVSAIESDFIFRPGQSLHGKYYAVVTLNQTALSGKEEDVAIKLLNIYFGLFTSLLKTATEVPNAVPEMATNKETRKKSKPKTAVSGLSQSEELREKLVSAVLTGVNRAYPYAGANGKSFTDHLETLFKVTHSSNFNTSVQAMLLIQQLSATHSASNDRFYRVLYESLLDPRLVAASKQQLYLNLLHRALRADLNMNRVKAFIKRLLQILSLHDPSFICGVFYLIQDLEKTFPSLTSLIDEPEDHDDDEEVFRDVDEDDATDARHEDAAEPKGSAYDAHKRAPEHANADQSCAWEIIPFVAHYHPSVAVSADHILRHAKLPGKPDLTLHTLIHFLDRFVYRNPKLSSTGLRGSSIMQPMAAADSSGVLIAASLGTHRKLPMNDDAFKAKDDGLVAAEDVFFHKYFTTLGKTTPKKVKASKKKDSKDDDESTDEDEVWKAMMDSAPDLEGDVDSDDDLDLSELASDMDESLADNMDDDAWGDEGVDLEPGIFDESEDDLQELEGAGDTDGDVSDFAGFDSEGDAGPKTSKSKSKAKRDEKKKMKSLPTFASAADYAKMLEDDDDEDF